MSSFWSGWVIFFVVLNWALVTGLFVYAMVVKIPTDDDGTTGHVWAHGVLREGVRKLPLWWGLISVGSLTFAIFYLFYYPGFGSHPGHLNWTAGQEVRQDLAVNATRESGFVKRIEQQSVAELAQQPDVIEQGHMLFADNCAACHGPQGQGNRLIGAPNLTDDIWLYGDGAAISHSIREGRRGNMPAFGTILDKKAIREVAEYVYTLSGGDTSHDQLVDAGEKRFATTCAACHGADGKGNPSLGAPNLTDQDWLYSDSISGIMTSIRDGRQGVMPAWKDRLSDTQIKILMAWMEAAEDAQRQP